MKLKIAIFLFFTSQLVVAQCAMCKAVVESGDAQMAAKLNNGIVYLMALPYVIVGLLFYTLYRYKKSKKL